MIPDEERQAILLLTRQGVNGEKGDSFTFSGFRLCRGRK